MGTPHRYLLSFALLVASCAVFGQRPVRPSIAEDYNPVLDINPRYHTRNDTVWIYSGVCKVLRIEILTGDEAAAFLKSQASPPKKIPFLRAHGTVQYDFTYRSFVDTPFSQRDFAQHSIQATIDLVFRDRYPLRLVIGSRRSNSPYFDDITDVNLQFSRKAFLNSIKARLYEKLSPPGITPPNLADLEKLYNEKKFEVAQLQGWLNHPARLQQIIEEREAALGKPAGNHSIDSYKSKLADSLSAKSGAIKNSLLAQDTLSKSTAVERFERKKQELDSLVKQLKSYEQKLKATRGLAQDSIAKLKSKLAAISDPGQLTEFASQHKLDSSEFPKGWKILSVINTLGIGRTWVDYSDLTVKNISLTGINAEITPSKFYFALAAGRVNYRFRDFVIRNNSRPVQSLYMMRAGLGKPEANNFILSWYDGKKNLLNPFGTAAGAGNLERVMGMSAETRVQLNANTFFVFEVAKSSFNTTANIGQGSHRLMQRVWNFKDRSNEAYSIRASSYWPEAGTRITGYYRKMGNHFQSFNLQPINVQQEAYQLKLQQSFWKKRLTLEAGLRKNDFNSPFINPGLSSKTVFKSIQATLRVPKYPFVSVGYYPSSQLTVLDNDLVVENQYNTLTVVTGHTYRLNGVGMSSNAVFLKFYNSGADTGFIYYNASSWTINQYIFFRNFQLQTGFTLTSQRELKVMTVEQSISWQLRQWLTLSGGLKYNHVNQTEILWGSTAGLGIIIKKLGTIQATYDKSFLPGINRDLLPVDMGKLSYFRTF
jgi:hypothetical protein